MATIRQINGGFISAYVKPKMVERTVQQLIPNSQNNQFGDKPPRRELDRRCGRDRRRQNQAILLDLRSPYARRKNYRRDSENNGALSGIDTYA